MSAKSKRKGKGGKEKEIPPEGSQEVDNSLELRRELIGVAQRLRKVASEEEQMLKELQKRRDKIILFLNAEKEKLEVSNESCSHCLFSFLRPSSPCTSQTEFVGCS